MEVVTHLPHGRDNGLPDSNRPDRSPQEARALLRPDLKAMPPVLQLPGPRGSHPPHLPGNFSSAKVWQKCFIRFYCVCHPNYRHMGQE
jgi:hypothetical protein